MAIFQKSVIKKHLNNLDKEQVEKAYQKFKENYSSARIKKIKELKEEEYQDGFLRDLFVDVFGYTLKPDENYNLAREFKNQGDGKKADGAIIKNEKAVAVIELKSTKTKDLKSITEQAFNYKNNQPNCKYVITSNFQKLRFYIEYANEFEEFDLFHLQKVDFESLYLILNSDNVFSDLPLKLKKETKFHEQEISDKLYKGYSVFKKKLYKNLIKNNPDNDRLTLFKKSQKLLDRFLFILFAEDSGLLPPNSISRITKRFEVLKEEDAYKPIYAIFKQYFGYMNTGRKGKTTADDIPAYNGGLFYPDLLLDNLKIDDEILIDDLLRLSEYDFNTEVDVNILGHIFEHSLSEIEEITVELTLTGDVATRDITTEDVVTEKATEKAAGEHAPLLSPVQSPLQQVSKRKKDGVFYTPKYITQYIVENTIGTLCTEKRNKLDIAEIEFDGSYKTKDGKLSAKGKKLFKTLENYKKWLVTLKIVDPACGSGAFLNQALVFLIAEHKTIDDIITELTGEAIRLFDTDKAILENNLYGVDINDESVEIAKLSLWLRTAQKGRKLSNLNSNIKCGNSLIDDPEIAGDKAFDWHKEFPQVFRKKKKKAWHITTATHNSRYSQRMFDNHIKLGEAVWIGEKDEIIVTETIAEIVKEDKLNILAYNICGDHMHIVLVCDEEEASKIMQKIKSMSARTCNIAMGRTIPATDNTTTTVEQTTAEHAPQLSKNTTTSVEHAPLMSPSQSPLHNTQARGNTQSHLWARKSGTREITINNDLHNVISYIRNNRQKHELPENNKLEKIISEMTCSVEYAFRTEYKGGFDVVIGNPPYVRVQGLKKHYYSQTAYYENKFQSATGNYDIYALFMEKSFDLINAKGIVSFILPHKFLISNFGKGIRKYFIDNKAVSSIVHFGAELVFQDSTTYTCIVNLSKGKKEYLKFNHLKPEQLFDEVEFTKIHYSKLSNEQWILTNSKVSEVLDKINLQPLKLKNVFIRFVQGIITGKDAVFCIKGDLKGEFLTIVDEKGVKHKIEKGILKPHLRGEDVNKYRPLENKEWLIFPYFLINEKAELLTSNELETKYPNTLNYLKVYEKALRERENGKFNCEYWYQYSRNQAISVLEQIKIITPEICFGGSMTLDENNFYHNSKCHTLLLKENSGFTYRSILPLINSSLFWFYLVNTGNVLRGGYIGVKRKVLEPFSIPSPDLIDNKKLEIFTELMLGNNAKHQEIINKFIKYFRSKFAIEKLSRKLQNWHELEFGEFIKGLNKAIKKAGGEKLSKSNEMDWMEVFETKKAEAQSLKSVIDKTDKEIDQMVYELYGLSAEEIKIVEDNA